jgi:3-deoxy-D-manno-octulosonic-acid transferase
MQLLYSFVVRLVRGLLTFIPLSGKTKQFVEGRKHIWNDIKKIPNKKSVIWMHCASLGEYEQGLPVLKSLQSEDPDSFYLVTFFSPSGYHVKKTHQVADLTTYLPWDNRSDIRRFIKHLQPTKVLFVKYDFWPNLLRELHKQQVPTYLIAGLFQSRQVFFKPWCGWFRKLLRGFSHIFVQDEESQQLLHKIGITQTSVSGDTRFDRVQQQKQNLSFMKTFVGDRKCIVAGSTWSQDIDVLKEAINHTPKGWCWLIAPHEINKQQLLKLIEQLPSTAQRYTTRQKHNLSQTPVLVLDTIGLLSSCYQYGHIAYVGGAMGGSGLHNILEPAATGLPIVIGKNYHQFPEAVDLIKKGGVISISTKTDAVKHLNNLMQNPSKRGEKGTVNLSYITSKAGATERIIKLLSANA